MMGSHIMNKRDPHRHLTRAEVLAIRKHYGAGFTVREIAAQTGVNEKSVRDIVMFRSHQRVKDARNLPRLPDRRPRDRSPGWGKRAVQAMNAAREAEFERMVEQEMARLNKKDLRVEARMTARHRRRSGAR